MSERETGRASSRRGPRLGKVGGDRRAVFCGGNSMGRRGFGGASPGNCVVALLGAVFSLALLPSRTALACFRNSSISACSDSLAGFACFGAFGSVAGLLRCGGFFGAWPAKW